MGDMIHKPDHYCFSKFEPKDVIREWGLNFNLGSAVKYIARAGRKDNIIQDLKKAKEFLTFEIEALEAERTKNNSPEHPNCRCSTYPYLVDILMMDSKTFIETYKGKRYPTVLLGTIGDKWGVRDIRVEYGGFHESLVSVSFDCERLSKPFTRMSVRLR